MSITATAIKLKKQSRVLAITFDDDSSYELSFEYLRVMSPSAEVKGHGPGQEVLQWGKQNVDINKIKPVGHYAVQLYYDDGHDTGIYSWQYFKDLGENYENNWQEYIDKLDAAGKPRDPDLQILKL